MNHGAMPSQSAAPHVADAIPLSCGSTPIYSMRLSLIIVGIILITSCGAHHEKSVDQKATGFKVEYSGALKNMMHKGDISATADLKHFEDSEHFYALGALENLEGEIQVFDSKPFNTMVVDSTLAFHRSFDRKATLLVHATVKEWKSIAIPDAIESHADLEAYLERAAKEHNIPTSSPFPFLIEGTIKSFDWHVINWKKGDTEHSHAKHISSGLHGTEKNREVELLGFYSDAHHAVFTHHTTNMHIHVKTSDDALAGHVDDLTLGKGMLLKLPLVQ